MMLRDLLTSEARCDGRFGTLAVTGISADSRTVKPGFLFVAVRGTKSDGLAFLPQAVAAGAVAVLTECELSAPLPAHVALVNVPDVRRALALAAAKFYPRQPATIAAVTGTSGKTSVTAFTRQIWTALGHAAASIGTVGVVTPAGEETFLINGGKRRAMHYVIKAEIGGLTGVVASVLGKTPPDSHVWILTGEAPAFVKSESPFFAGGPLWRIELVSPKWP